MNNENKITNYLTYLYIISVFLFLSIVINARVTYQDSWILDNITIPIILYTIVFICFFVNNDNLYKIVIFSSIFLISLNFVPGLKYTFFYGNAIDHGFHYRFLQDIVIQNSVPKGRLYSEMPLMHIFLVTLSKFTNLNIEFIIKYGLAFCFGIFPFIAYSISRTIYANHKYIKYSILGSTIPLSTYYYQLGGTSFPNLLLFFLILCISKMFLFKKNQFQYSVLTIIFMYSIILSHSYTPLILNIVMILILLFYKIWDVMHHEIYFKRIQKKLLSIIGISVTFFVAYWMHEATFFFKLLTEKIYFYTSHIKSPKPPIPSRFFEISFTSKIEILTVYHITDFIILILTFIGIYLFWKKYKNGETFNTRILLLILFYYLSLLFIITSNFILKVGDMETIRLITYMALATPIFVGITIKSLDEFINNKTIVCLLLCSLFMIFYVQYYPAQPLVPKMNIDDSTEDYLVFVNMANSIYQIKVIDFVGTKPPIGSIIGGDRVTLHQIHGFMNYTFVQDYVLGYSALTENPNRKWGSDTYDFIVVHKAGKAGILVEQFEFRNDEFILNIVTNTDLIYNNGESFVLKGMIPNARKLT